MEPLSLEFMAGSCGGKIANATPDLLVQRVCSDSRALQQGDLFVALRGENFDGHTFLNEAFAKGAAAALVEEGHLPPTVSGPVVVVRNSRAALGRIAASYRRSLSLPLIAVAGSNGKTSTKELIAAVLRQRFKTGASEASFNNDIGVPLTLLKLDRSHEAAVVEIGTNHPGELRPLADIAQPTYGVITCIGREHLEFFGTVEGVAEEEGSLAAALPTSGKLFLHGDSPEISGIMARSKAPVTLCGAGRQNAWRLLDARLSLSGTHFRIASPRADLAGDYQIGLLGRHQALNAIFAIALGAELGLSREQIAAGLAQCAPAKMRLEIVRLNSLTLINDAYNANADSMAAALQTLSSIDVPGRRVAILGDMGELGQEAQAAHEEVGRRTAETKINLLITVGTNSRLTAQAAAQAGVNAVHFPDFDAAFDGVQKLVQPADTVLIKASRSARLERIVEALRKI